MSLQDFHYDLPPELIAQQPLEHRTASRLLHVNRQGILEDTGFPSLPGLLNPGDLLVLNDTRVVPARLYGRKASGGRIEMLLERDLGQGLARVQLRASRSPVPGTTLEFDGGTTAQVMDRDGQFFILKFSGDMDRALATHGHMPLPPYIKRPDTAEDKQRYQTVYARENGAVAAPTAGLHFDRPLLEALQQKGVRIAALTLHVGAGTFRPLQPEQLAAGRLHSERVQVPDDLCAAVAVARAGGHRVIAVGTTVVRALETAALAAESRPEKQRRTTAAAATAATELAPFAGETELFIRPGYRFRVADAMVTNFHLPESSLLMLVCAFAGTDRMLAAYRHAVMHRYRFFSYGDAMLIERANGAAL